MPGLLKRPSAARDEDEEEEDNSTIRARSKRQRLSPNGHGSNAGDAESDDASSDDDNDDAGLVIDRDEIREQARRRANRPQRAAQNGIIESIHCINFMCHSNLNVELGPLINFVIGHNGSGKSAVLTALQICLGGKASSTNRANTLKAFIKEGQDTCTLTVSIKNTDGFQHEVYGDSIRVERSFTRSGTSGFKIKNASRKTIATTRAALDEILDYYALTLDNPICVLTQDNARQFLAHSSATDKYKFFIKGVQLEQLNQDYELLNNSIDHIDSIYESRQASLKHLEKATKDTERRLEVLTQFDRLERRLGLLSEQMAWAQVGEQESILEDLSKQVRDAEAAVEASRAESELKAAVFDRANSAVEEATNLESAAREQLTPIQDELKEAEKQRDDKNHNLERLHADQRSLKDRQAKLRESILKTKNDIAVERGRLERETGGTAAMRQDRLNKAKAELATAETSLAQAKGRLPELGNSKDAAEKAFKDQLQPHQSIERDVNAAEARLRSLENPHDRARTGFDPNLDKLTDAINRCTDFRQKPVGPIGKHIRLLQPKWSGVIEKIIGKGLEGFIVTCREDRDKLNSLMDRTRCIAPINIVVSQPRIDISTNSPDTHFPTVAQSLAVENDLVFNQLVIQQRIEQLLLIEDEQRASDFMSRGKVRNVVACYTLDRIEETVGHCLVWHSIGRGFSSNYVEKHAGPPRMQVDLRDQIEAQRSLIDKLNKKLSDSDQERKVLQSTAKACDRAFARGHDEARDLGQAVDRARRLCHKIEDEISKSTIEEGRLGELQKQLDDLRTAKVNEEGTYDAMCDDKEEQLTELQRRIADVEAIEARRLAVTEEVGRAERAKNRKARDRHDALRAQNDALVRLERAKSAHDELISNQQAQDKKVQEYLTQASDAVDGKDRIPVPEDETSDTLEAKLNKLHKDAEEYQQRAGGSRDKVTEDHREALAAFRNFERAMKAEAILVTVMKQTLDDRRKRWKSFRKYITARARFNFTCYLTERAFKGELLVDHDKGQLQLNIQPNELEKRSAGRQAATLSGGEKSFSTICLILSLWEAICAPVRCLDEFDVFMDSANRSVTTQLLITCARQASERQFIFITPQSMSSISDGDDIRIIKMRDPERGQTTLNFGN